MNSMSEGKNSGAVGHTPVPWEYRPCKHDDWGWIRGPAVGPADDFGPLVAIARDGSWDISNHEKHRIDGTDPFEANAAFICEAVNNHDRLTAQLALARKALEQMLAEHGDDHYHTCPANEDGACDCFAGALHAEARAILSQISQGEEK